MPINSTDGTQDDSQHELVRFGTSLQTTSGLGESPGMNDERPSILSDPKKEKNFDTRPNESSNPPNTDHIGGSRRKKSKSSRVARKSRNASTRRRRRRRSNRRRRTARK